MLSRPFTAAAIAAIFTSLTSNVHGHGHLVSPRSRNYVAKQDGKWGGDATTPYPESCPHCLNIGGTEASCGKIEGRNYDYPKNSLGGNLAPAIQACYAERDVVQLDVILTAHHMGHFSYKACAINAGGVASQECFDSNPLTFVEDVLYGSLPDPNYPSRAYIPRADSTFIQKDSNDDYKFSHRFRLPDGLSGELVLLQWHYITGNSCLADEGYLNYDFPAGFEPKLQIGVCNSIPSDGRGVPEQFWNCAEIRISSDCASNPPPSPSGGSPPPSGSGTCGDGNRGDGICSDGLCCSKYGWCGTSSGHCSSSDGSGTPPPPSPAGTCGDGNRGDGICSDGKCCSKYGWCGTSSGHCSSGRMLRGMNTTAGELELELEMGAEVFDLIEETDANDDNNSFDVFDVPIEHSVDIDSES